MNNLRMTIRTAGDVCSVFKLNRSQSGGFAPDMAARRYVWFVSAAAKPRFTGTYSECLTFISRSGADFMIEHGIPC